MQIITVEQLERLTNEALERARASEDDNAAAVFAPENVDVVQEFLASNGIGNPVIVAIAMAFLDFGGQLANEAAKGLVEA